MQHAISILEQARIEAMAQEAERLDAGADRTAEHHRAIALSCGRAIDALQAKQRPSDEVNSPSMNLGGAGFKVSGTNAHSGIILEALKGIRQRVSGYDVAAIDFAIGAIMRLEKIDNPLHQFLRPVTGL